MLKKNDVNYRQMLPDAALTDFVQYFWHLQNDASKAKTVTVLPDGYFDILFVFFSNQPIYCSLVGLVTRPAEYTIPVGATTFAISFKLLAAEYLLHTDIASLIDNAVPLPTSFWGMEPTDFSSFAGFVGKVTNTLTELADKAIDFRKQLLFNLIYASNGSTSVEEVANSVGWRSRQINRYFNHRFGISLKAYCTILRYRASFAHLKDGQLHPEQLYADQSHFIREIRKYSGVTPRQLAENKNDRFIQLSTLPKP